MNQSSNNNSDLIDSVKQFFIDFTSFNGYYLIPSLGGISFGINLICLIAFFSPKFKQKAQFKYVITNVLIESVMTGGLIFFRNGLCFYKCVIYNSYIAQFSRAYLLNYVGNSLFILTGYIEIFLTLERYLMLKGIRNFFTNQSNFKYIILTCVLIAFGSFTPILFAYQIKPHQNQTGLYMLDVSKFGSTPDFNVYVISVLSINNSFAIIVLIILSILVVKEVKRFQSSEKALGSKISNMNTVCSENDLKAIVHYPIRENNSSNRKKSEMNFIKITLTLNFLYLLMRGVDTVSVSLYRSDLNNGITYRPVTVLFKNLTFITVPIVCGLNILILASFNNMFKYAIKNKKVKVEPIKAFY